MDNEPRSRSKRKWIKLYCYGILHGSISYQLTEPEQSCWVKLLCFAGLIGREGQISDNDGRAFPHEFIAHELHTSLEVLEHTLIKCKEEGRLTEDEGGIHITNWKAYQSEYDRQKPYRLKAQLEASQAEGQAEGKNIYAIYSEEIGELTPMIAEKLKDLETRYPQEDIIDAIGEAVRGNVRKLVYIEKILENWAREGKSTGEPEDPQLARYGGRASLISQIYRAKIAKGEKWSADNTRGKPADYLLELAKELGIGGES